MAETTPCLDGSYALKAYLERQRLVGTVVYFRDEELSLIQMVRSRIQTQFTRLSCRDMPFSLAERMSGRSLLDYMGADSSQHKRPSHRLFYPSNGLRSEYTI